VQTSTSGDKTLTATATGTSNDETFSGEDDVTISVDTTPPAVTIAPPPPYSSTASPTFSWGATDFQSPIANFDVDAAIDQGGWVSQLIGSTQTSITLSAADGQLLRLRVRATDTAGNTSAWTEVSTSIDTLPPVVTFGAPDFSTRGTVRVPVHFENPGSPVTGRFTFSDNAGGRTGVVASDQYVSYKNIIAKNITATLRVSATDALGRATTVVQDYTVPPRLAHNSLRVKKIARVGSFVKVSGTTSKGYTGKVTLSAARIGSKGTKRASKRVSVKNSRFNVSVRVADGKYKFTLAASATSKFFETSFSKKLTVR
jgi:hypothetical protein